MRAVFLLLLAACEHDLLKELPDAALPDAPGPDAALHCPTQTATPLPPGNHIVFLSTEGVTLIHASLNDATLNQTNLIQTTTVTVPPFLDGVPGRDAYIAQILQHARNILAPYSIDIVTTRPHTGDYHLFSLGGDPQTLLGTCTGCLSVTSSNCTAMPRSVDLMFDVGYAGPTTDYAYTFASDLGLILGLAGVDEHGDCMCRFASTCSGSLTTECTFGTHATVTQMGSPNTCGRTTQDEPALLRDALGCR
jgi:hypothetical protein